ncbi:MAG: thiamine pyrophosphate-binding protein [SAR202 cluster bacterium]|nr:thiamine pyrophosphate-binding protein [SAR202 cluster bacterium]
MTMIGRVIMAKMTGARFIAETFKGYGVSTVFFVPSILKLGLVEMEKVGIRRILCHSEKSAAYMADAYARVTHRPGVAMAQSVGAANLASGLQDAYLASSPVIAISGRAPMAKRPNHNYQEIDHRPLYDPVTKYNVYVDTPQQLAPHLRQAFREAVSGTPGPVHLDLSGIRGEEVTEVEADYDVIIEETFASYPPFRPEPESERVRQAARLLAQAQRPVMVAGGGATASGASAEVVKLAEMLSMPVATALNGKNLIPDNHPLSVGVVGTYSRWCANQVVYEADLVLYVGSQTSDQSTNVWTTPKKGTKVIQIDINPEELGRSYPNVVSLMGDARQTLRKIIEASEAISRPSWTKRAQDLVKQWRQELEPKMTSQDAPTRPERLCRELSNWLPGNSVLVSDTGHAGIWTGTMVDLTQPGQTFIRCAGSLGWGFPAALGAKAAAPERPVVCFTGDGGMWYHIGELETAVRSGLNAIIVVNNNRSLNQDRAGVERAYGSAPGNKEEIWVFNDVDFAKVAQSMGAAGIRVNKPGQLKGALEQALEESKRKPVVVDVVTDKDIIAPLAKMPG